jgi:type I restriction enzyme, S subunit
MGAAQRQVDALTPSLPPSPSLRRTSLARAFAGKLVPQNPADEPASELLKQIQKQAA